MNQTDLALAGAAVLTGVLHTAIPDHWLPFVLIGRARAWSARRTAALSALAAAIHIAGSALLGLLAVLVGRAWAGSFGETLVHTGAGLLIVFGLGYAGWAWKNRGHFHPGGARLHRHTVDECDGREGDDRPEHLHYHAEAGLIVERGRWSGWLLAAIVGINPCVVLLPTLLAAAPRGAGVTALVIGAYGLPTAALMVGLSAAGVAGGRRIRLPGLARHMETASGAIVALLGLFLLVSH